VLRISELNTARRLAENTTNKVKIEPRGEFMATSEQEPRTIPGMRSDLKPQPYQDPDFGPGMEYESGDLNQNSSEADEIRKRWKESGRSKDVQPGGKQKRTA
jgi:hypothetical protein